MANNIGSRQINGKGALGVGVSSCPHSSVKNHNTLLAFVKTSAANKSTYQRVILRFLCLMTSKLEGLVITLNIS